MGVVALNERLNLHLGLDDILFCYALVRVMPQQMYYLKAQDPTMYLVTHLPDSDKGYKDDLLIFGGQWERGPGPEYAANLWCPKQWKTTSTSALLSHSLLSFLHLRVLTLL